MPARGEGSAMGYDRRLDGFLRIGILVMLVLFLARFGLPFPGRVWLLLLGTGVVGYHLGRLEQAVVARPHAGGLLDPENSVTARWLGRGVRPSPSEGFTTPPGVWDRVALDSNADDRTREL